MATRVVTNTHSCCVLGQCSQASSSSSSPCHPAPPPPPSSIPTRHSPPTRRTASMLRAPPSTDRFSQPSPQRCRHTSEEAVQAFISRHNGNEVTPRNQITLPPGTPESEHGSYHHSRSSPPRTEPGHPLHTSALPSSDHLKGRTTRRMSHHPPSHLQSHPQHRQCEEATTPAPNAQQRLCYDADGQIAHARVHLRPHPSSSSFCHRAQRPPRRSRSKMGLSMLRMLVVTAAASLAIFAPLMVKASLESSLSFSDHTPRQMSKRALPATYQDFVNPLLKRQTTTADISPDNYNTITLSPPATCSTLNITWDPSKGTPPFTLAVFVELWFPLAIVSIPATYADPTLPLWLYQIELPQFQGGPIAVGNTPSVFASIVDSTGLMANTSSFLTVDNNDISCARDSTPLEFTTWSTGAPVQCQPWSLGWNLSTPAFVGPLVGMILPEGRPPVLLNTPENLILNSDGTGGMEWLVAIPAGTFIAYSLLDGGTGGSGGMGGKNLVGLDQYSGSVCPLENPIGLATPTTTAAEMTVTPDYPTAIVTTIDGQVTTITTVVTPGKGGGTEFTTGSIVGVALGIGAAAGLTIALVFFCFYRRRQRKRETLWEMPGGSSDYPKGMPVDRRFAGLGNGSSKNSDGGNGHGVKLSLDPRAGMRGGVEGLRRNQSLRGSFRSLGSSAYDARGDGSGDHLGSPTSSPPTPARLYMGNLPFSDDSYRSPDGGGSGIYNSRSRTDRSEGGPERDALFVTNQTSPPLQPSHYKGGSMGSGRGPSSNLASAYRSVLGSPEGINDDAYEEVQLNDRRPSPGSGHDQAHSSSRRDSMRSRRVNSLRVDASVPPVPAFPDAYRRSPDTTSPGGMSLSHTLSGGTGVGSPGTGTGTHRSGNVVIHSDAGLLMDDRLSDDDSGDAGELLELPPQYASLPTRAHATAAGSSPTAAAAVAMGQHPSGAHTLSPTDAAAMHARVYGRSDGEAARRSATMTSQERRRRRGAPGIGDVKDPEAPAPSQQQHMRQEHDDPVEEEGGDQFTATGISEDPFQSPVEALPRPSAMGALASNNITTATTANSNSNSTNGRNRSRQRQRRHQQEEEEGEEEEALRDEAEAEAEARRAQRGTLDAFVGNENDDAFWLR